MSDGPRQPVAMPQTGDPCPECSGGHLVVYSGHTRGTMHVRYLKCWKCERAPANNKAVIRAEQVPKRRSRKCPNNVQTSFVIEQQEG